MEVSQPLDHITHAVIGGGKTIDFGISNSAEFYDILSRTLYTDPELAVIREILCNAWDAHIEAGRTDRPIRITLDNDYLTVRDYGHGIPHAQIGPIYGVYGASTKKQDGRSTGGFGLGCKAPFAYTDHFEVISYNGGVQSIYNMSKSSAQRMGKPGINVIAQAPTEEFGLQVKMPIKSRDYFRFERLIKRIVANGEMYAYYDGRELERIPFSQAPHGYYFTTKQVMSDHHKHQLLLRYGAVIYPIPEANEINDLRRKVMTIVNRVDGESYNHTYQLILQAPPDSISITPSREALSMQEHTINTLNKLFTAFLQNVAGLDAEVLTQAKVLTDAAVTAKNYTAIFSQTWGFDSSQCKNPNDDLTTLVDLAQHQLAKKYPASAKFRVKDVDYRIRKAKELKVVDPHLATTFLEKLPALSDTPTKYHWADRKDRSDWLHRRVVGKVWAKLDKAGMDTSGLYIVDSMDPSRNYGDSEIIPFRQSARRHHLINLPFLRKAVVITKAMTTTQERLRNYGYRNPGTPTDGLLCYHVKSRKVGSTEAAVQFFTDLGYEVIDLTQRFAWEPKPNPPAERMKREPKPFELPALSNCYNGIDLGLGRWRKDDAVKLTAPEFVLVISSRDCDTGVLNGYSQASTKAIAHLFGDRIGIAKDQGEYKWAIRKGAKDFEEFLHEQLPLELMTSPNIAEYLAYAHYRVAKGTNRHTCNQDALKLIYTTPELRAEFGLKNNLTEDEIAWVKIFQHSPGLPSKVTQPIHDYAETIPLAPENQVAFAAVSGNDLLDMLNFTYVRIGLKDTKRPIYLDILTKALKG